MPSKKRHKGRPARNPAHPGKIQEAFASLAQPVAQIAHTVEQFKEREKKLIDTLNEILQDIHKRLADLEVNAFGEARGEKGEEDVQMPEVPEIDAVPTTDAPPDRVQGEGVPGPGDGDRESVPGDQEGDPGVRELP